MFKDIEYFYNKFNRSLLNKNKESSIKSYNQLKIMLKSYLIYLESRYETSVKF